MFAERQLACSLYLDGAGAGELAHGQLHEVERPPDEDENHQVRDEKSTASILIG